MLASLCSNGLSVRIASQHSKLSYTVRSLPRLTTRGSFELGCGAECGVCEVIKDPAVHGIMLGCSGLALT